MTKLTQPIQEPLLDEGSLASAAVKARTLETFLNSVGRENKFVDFINEILRAIADAVKSESGSIIELNHETRTLFFRAAFGQGSDRVHEIVIPFGQGIVGHVAESKQPMIVNDLDRSVKHLKSVQSTVGFSSRNLIAIPILIRGRVYGVLELLNKIGDEGFTNEDLELLSSLTQSAAKAIEVRLMLAWALRSGASAPARAKEAA